MYIIMIIATILLKDIICVEQYLTYLVGRLENEISISCNVGIAVLFSKETLLVWVPTDIF